MKSRKKLQWIMAACLVLSSGCATMNVSECQNADWEMIGFEDGSKGRLSSYVGNHREACAKHNITPDLAAYLKGHESGVDQFCTESNGFLQGKKGRAYNGVCPPESGELFLRGYRIGEKHYSVLKAIEQLESSVKSDQRRVKELKAQVRKCEGRLVREGATESERRQLLEEIKRDQREIRRIERKIHRAKRDLRGEKYEYEQLQYQYNTY